MDVHDKTTTFCLFDPGLPEARQYSTVTRPTTAEEIATVLSPHQGASEVAYEVGVQAPWVAQVVRPWAARVEVVNASRVPWLFRDGRKNDCIDARKLATLLYLRQLPRVHLPSPQVSAWRALIQDRRVDRQEPGHGAWS
jgi:hypothetical protein